MTNFVEDDLTYVDVPVVVYTVVDAFHTAYCVTDDDEMKLSDSFPLESVTGTYMPAVPGVEVDMSVDRASAVPAVPVAVLEPAWRPVASCTVPSSSNVAPTVVVPRCRLSTYALVARLPFFDGV